MALPIISPLFYQSPIIIIILSQRRTLARCFIDHNPDRHGAYTSREPIPAPLVHSFNCALTPSHNFEKT